MKRMKRFFRTQVRQTITHTHTHHTPCVTLTEKEKETHATNTTHTSKRTTTTTTMFSPLLSSSLSSSLLSSSSQHRERKGFNNATMLKKTKKRERKNASKTTGRGGGGAFVVVVVVATAPTPPPSLRRPFLSTTQKTISSSKDFIKDCCYSSRTFSLPKSSSSKSSNTSSSSPSFRLILMRHSEAVEDQKTQRYARDIDRPLTDRGAEYAKRLGAHLKTIAGKEWEPTRIVCSSAKRTRETLEAMDLECMMNHSSSSSSSSSSGKANNNNNNNNNNYGGAVLFLGSIYHYAGMDGVFGSHVKQLIVGESETFEEEQTDEVVLIVGHNRGLEEAVREFTGRSDVEMTVASLACLRKTREPNTRETWEQALEEKGENAESLWTLEHLLDRNGQCLDCGWGDVPRG